LVLYRDNIDLPVIARFTTLLPFDLLIREGDLLPAFDLEAYGYRIRFYPPTTFTDRPASTDSVLSPLFALSRIQPVNFTETLLVDGRRTGRVNVLVIDFNKETFDRSRDKTPLTDPPATVAFGIANSVLARIRVYSRSWEIKPLEPNRDAWHIQYLTDELQPLEIEDGKVRGVQHGSGVIGTVALTPEALQLVADRSSSEEPYIWDQLLLDSYAQLPDAGGAVVMASAALETFIEWALNVLEKAAPLQNGLWEWINKRDHWTKEPSVSEQFDVLLRVFTQRSLKDEPKLWQGFVELRKARNSLSHEGVAKLGADALEADKARVLVNGADGIIKWVEGLLPEQHRRARTDAAGPFTRRLASADEADVITPAGMQLVAGKQNRGPLRVRREPQPTLSTTGSTADTNTDVEPKHRAGSGPGRKSGERATTSKTVSKAANTRKGGKPGRTK